MAYDVTLGGISFVSMEQDFSETVGSDYELVGAAVMPGPPRPLAFYNITIPIHGDAAEADQKAFGDALRSQIRSLLQNAPARFEGLEFTTTFDPELDGWLVIGQADISYGPGGPTFGDYVLRINSAALIPAQQTLFSLQVFSPPVAGVPVAARHYLPVEAYDVIGQVEPYVVPLKTYSTLEGQGVYIEDRPHGEQLTYSQPFAAAGRGDVRVYDRRGNTRPEYSQAGDLSPETYGWLRAYGPLFSFTPDDVPVLDNGRCRVRYDGGSRFVVDTVKGGRYAPGNEAVTLGYGELVSATLLEVVSDHATLAVKFRGHGSLAAATIQLGRGWEGPRIDVVDHGRQRVRVTAKSSDANVEQGGHRATVSVGEAASLPPARARRRVVPA